MLREIIEPQLAARSITLQKLIYSQSSVTVYEGQFGTYHAAVKVTELPPHCDPSSMQREEQALLHLSHAHILRLYDSFYVGVYSVIVTEWCAKDLGRDIEDRKKNVYPYTEQEILHFLRTVVDALAYMQSNGFAHRDIKPANIFIDSEHQYKIGDLGSALWNIQPNVQTDLTLIGTPMYLSPLLRRQLIQQEMRVKHDPFRSDVYSLGLTVLHMALLEFPGSYFDLRTSQETKANTIYSLPFSSDIKNVLSWMLADDESKRCTFIELNNWLSFNPAVAMPSGTTIVTPSIPAVHQQTVQYLRGQPETRCLGEKCKKVINPTKLKDTVSLLCFPSEHIFCSGDCFAIFCYSHQSKSSMVCPTCGYPISEDLWLDYSRPKTSDQEVPRLLNPPSKASPSKAQKAPSVQNAPPARRKKKCCCVIS